jgi:GNAT superfamily N-acetyltransferase
MSAPTSLPSWRDPFLRAYPREASTLGAAFDGIHDCEIYVHTEDTGSCAFLVNTGGDLFLAGDCGLSQAPEALRKVLDPKGRYSNTGPNSGDWILAIPSDDEWADWVESALLGRITRVPRQYFKWSGQLPAEAEARYETCLVDSAIAKTALNDLSEELFDSWDGVDRFLANGFGSAVLIDGKLASVCLTYALGAGEAEVNIFTAQEFRQQGFGYLVARAFLEQCESRNLNPAWSCGQSNKASAALAIQLGFQPAPKYWWLEVEMNPNNASP